MMAVIRHRGPDGEGVYNAISGSGLQIALGHRRLSIIDPAGGAQPMLSRDRKTVLTFNGEIYNFREIRAQLAAEGRHTFQTDSDTEVLLAAYARWGTECLQHLRGMFAFAIWDEDKAALFLARDRYGKKPLFLLQLDDGVAFASEIKALLALPRVDAKLNVSALRPYLFFRYIPGPQTFFERIQKLPPGCFAVYFDGQLKQERYFTPPELTEETIAISDDEAVASYSRLLDDCVRSRLVSDVPFGAFLSGGLDSSSIVAIMARHLTSPVRTFSVGFTGAQQSELPFAERVARWFRTEHRSVTVTPEDYASAVVPTIRALDAPISEPATIPLLLLSRAASQHVKMVLSGEGADEFLGGYSKHIYERFSPIYHRLPNSVDRALRRIVASLPSRRFQRSKRALDALAERDPRIRHALWFSAFSNGEIRALAAPQNLEPTGICRNGHVARSPLRELLLFDQASWLPDNLLERGDRVSMANSLELRMPFMDHQLAALSARLPDRMRIRWMRGKWLLRRAMKRELPPEIVSRPKEGFPVPLAAWFRSSLKPMISDLLLDSRGPISALIPRCRVEKAIHDHATGSIDATKPLWLYFNLNLFFREYRLAL
jgi:asparagine synthase (glutamine-hydrolysing)